MGLATSRPRGDWGEKATADHLAQSAVLTAITAQVPPRIAASLTLLRPGFAGILDAMLTRRSGLAPQFDGYTLLQLTDLHISRLFPAVWARAVAERANGLGAKLIVVTGDLIDGTVRGWRITPRWGCASSRTVTPSYTSNPGHW
jgi:hypothetical protein